MFPSDWKPSSSHPGIKHGLIDTHGGHGHRIIDDGENVMKRKLSLSIEGIHCGACVNRVTAALQIVAGVELGSVEVGSARLTFDPFKASEAEITSAINQIGFQAIIVN